MALITNVLFITLCLIPQHCEGIEAKARKAQLALQGGTAELPPASTAVSEQPTLRRWKSELGAAADKSIVLTAINAHVKAASCSWWNPFACIWEGLKEIGEAIAVAALQAIGVIPDEPPAKLGGHSVTYVNIVFCSVVAGMLLFVGLGKLVDQRWPMPFGKGRPPAWVIFWLVASYSLLVPGIICILFSFNIWTSFTILGTATVRYNLTRNPTTGNPSSISESMISFIHMLWTSGGRLGAVLVVAYAIVIPCVKVFLLIFGEYWRNSTDERTLAWSRRCIMTVQMVSKWASPDMFAYILMLYLFRNMNHPPMLVATADLEIGFISFTLFCLNSTFASLAISLPALPEVPSASKSPSSRNDSQPFCVRCCGRFGVGTMALILAAGFFVCWGVGIFWPCMALKLELQDMKISDSVKELLQSLDFESLVNADVSLWKCLIATAGWLCRGEAATIMAFFLIGGFVMLLPVVDVVVLLVTAFTHKPVYVLTEIPSTFSDEAVAKRSPHWGMTISHYINHIAMLDVFIMGIVVICAAGSSYRSKGIGIELDYGMYPLICAEALHYTLYYFVSSVCAEDEE